MGNSWFDQCSWSPLGLSMNSLLQDLASVLHSGCTQLLAVYLGFAFAHQFSVNPWWQLHRTLDLSSHLGTVQVPLLNWQWPQWYHLLWLCPISKCHKILPDITLVINEGRHNGIQLKKYLEFETFCYWLSMPRELLTNSPISVLRRGNEPLQYNVTDDLNTLASVCMYAV